MTEGQRYRKTERNVKISKHFIKFYYSFSAVLFFIISGGKLTESNFEQLDEKTE